MMTRTQFLLGKLAEEASEVVKLALKAQQFGLQESREGDYPTNAIRLKGEIQDVFTHVHMLNEESELGFSLNPTAMYAKMDKVEKYYKYSVQLGQVEPLEVKEG